MLSRARRCPSWSAAALAFALSTLLGGCGRGGAPSSDEPLPAPATPEPIAREPAPERPACASRLRQYAAGHWKRALCPAEIAAAGLTVLDLSDDWAPSIFDEAPELGDRGAQPYKETLVALANERLGDGPEFDRAKDDRYFELYGIFPSIAVVRGRLVDDDRHRCHAAVDDTALERLTREVDPWRDLAKQRSDRAFARTLSRKLEAEVRRRGLASIDALEGDAIFGTTLEQHRRVGTTVEAIAAAQAHLRCDGLLSKRAEDRVIDAATGRALRAFQRKHMIVAWQLDDDTRRALAEDSRELDFRALLRVLRERVADAAGLIEDGAAVGRPGEVVGRVLDASAFRGPASRDAVGAEPAKSAEPAAPIDGGAPDRLAEATDAAARALGWTSPEAARAFLDVAGPEGTRALRVAVKLPAPPRYHGEAMDLHAVIDRGDVWYDFPYGKHGEPRAQPVEHRPSLVLYAKDGDRDVALLRWPTTIGGWKPERLGKKKLGMVYKESPAGERVWRDIIASPAWIPPDTAPRRDLVRQRPDGSWAVKQDAFGPGYASAYGLAMLVHHRVAQIKNVADPLRDQGIRTHGSVSYDSIHTGTSHGCHRLHNHMALRLADFLLRHRAHVRHGAMPLDYGRTFPWEGKSMRLHFESRGFRFELTPPVPVEVLPGRLMGRTTPILEPMPLPDELADRFSQELFED